MSRQSSGACAGARVDREARDTMDRRRSGRISRDADELQIPRASAKILEDGSLYGAIAEIST
jgi:hypothetical protein